MGETVFFSDLKHSINLNHGVYNTFFHTILRAVLKKILTFVIFQRKEQQTNN